jgi:argininosuccinate lyase
MTDKKLWDGRFSGPTAELMEQINASIGFDIRLYDVDIEGSLAQAEALRNAGVLASDEWAVIVLGLHQVRKEIADGRYSPGIETEDIHMAVERRLIEIVGPVGGKIHTGRSRNDQVALDVRLWLKRELTDLTGLVTELQRVVIARAEEEIDTYLPGYTHLQQGQPIRLGHYLMSLFWMLDRDRGRLCDARSRADRMPLGAGALAGSAFPVDRAALCERLGLSAPTENSIDAVTDRDHLAETVFATAQLVTHLSRFAEDWIIWSSREFQFVELDDAYSTGSSMMPQKKNPDSLELIRGKTGRLYGNLTTLLTIQKGLPLTYGKDLQEDKEPLFDAVDTARTCVLVFGGALSTMSIRRDRMRDALDPSLYATDLADILVGRGLPFRDAHRVVGGLVGKAIKLGVDLTDLPWEEFASSSDLFEIKDLDLLTPESSTEARRAPGGTSRQSVLDQLTLAKQRIEGQEAR